MRASKNLEKNNAKVRFFIHIYIFSILLNHYGQIKICDLDRANFKERKGDQPISVDGSYRYMAPEFLAPSNLKIPWNEKVFLIYHMHKFVFKVGRLELWCNSLGNVPPFKAIYGFAARHNGQRTNGQENKESFRVGKTLSINKTSFLVIIQNLPFLKTHPML